LNPLIAGSRELPDAFFKSATSETQATGFVTNDYIPFYETLACIGKLRLITGNRHVSPYGQSTVRIGGIDSDDKFHGLCELTDAVNKLGSEIFSQLNFL